MTLFTILADSREKKGYSFDQYPVDVREVTLRTADYTIPKFCDRDEENDTYLPWLGVERKAGHDLLSSITTDRSRFKSEIRRADDWPKPMHVVVEEPLELFEKNMGLMDERDVHPNQVTGTVDSWSKFYNVEFEFFETKSQAEQRTFDLLFTWLRTIEYEE